jgi:RNA polymerase-binding transcription factor DksA
VEEIMSTNSIHLIEIPVGGNGGQVWNRLHSEREDICEALIKESATAVETGEAPGRLQAEDTRGNANWHCELLQARLRKVDDALDRLMVGTYGNCSKCGKWIEDTKLDFDPAIEFCLGCWPREQSRYIDESVREANALSSHVSQQSAVLNHLTELALETLAPFDTICVQTHNSDYRIFVLDPKRGRALVEGGLYFVEPVEAMISGSTSRDSGIRNGVLGVGLRIEMWVNGNLVSTSPVQSIRIEHNSSVALVTCSSMEM